MKHQQINNSNLKCKIDLRLKFLPNKDINVINAYCGENLIWKYIIDNFNNKINILNIDKKQYKEVILKGDNIKYLKSFNLSDYDVIDLDAYGIPFEQLEIIFKSNYKGIVFYTFITVGFGQINNKLLNKLGITNNMLCKIKSLFNFNGFDKFIGYLSLNGIKKTCFYTNNINKYYGYFEII